ncbi:hypothetical protein PR202_gb01536 [Eleusine coracana subsp. coracana]|uniref:E3 ubiquitin-protein ligase RMA n=1 Tax=Eleusine coracana subsp. coracana TaxID=191504 RepID=A0AAV5DWS7_ELECO|nr:hypothetical protein PR202_gb01536 [Eleusine coracana subsp. coracana]
MAADDAARSSRRMDLNLYLGLPRAPRARRPDLGSDLVLGTPMLSSSSPSSSAASADAPPLETDPVHPPYSPSRADLVRPPTPMHEPYYPSAPEVLVHSPYVPHPPPPVPEAAAMLADEPEFGFSDAPLRLIGRMDRPSSSTASSSFRPERAERPRRLICLTSPGRQSRYLRPRRFRSDLPPLSSEPPSLEDDAGAQPLEPEEPVRDTVEENKVVAAVAAVGVSEDEATERGKSAAMFECNICFEMAAEPVVTSCGHLFCWPCLYQWLHVHSTHKECPVCKGEVTAGNITPIYGRGNSGSDAEKKVEDGNASGPKIPPRPHGNRLESFRQQFHHLRPVSRRLGEAQGILSMWRRILDQHLMNSISRADTPESIAEESRFSRMTTRLRARRLLREVENPTFVASSASESGPPMSNTFDPPPRHTSSPLSSEGIDLLRQIAFSGLDDSERWTTALGDLRRIARPSHFGASTSSNPPNPEPVDGTNVAVLLAADQASNSSTMAVIQEDAAFTESAGEPSNAGSSRSLRRSRRSEALASLDVDGGDLHRNKRRRLN